MLTKNVREMERQASVVTVKSQQAGLRMPAGVYMEKQAVMGYISSTIGEPGLATVISERCSIVTQPNGMEFIPVSQIQIYMVADLFRKMECSVTSLLISEK